MPPSYKKTSETARACDGTNFTENCLLDCRCSFSFRLGEGVSVDIRRSAQVGMPQEILSQL